MITRDGDELFFNRKEREAAGRQLSFKKKQWD
jgi:hypothetical protein